MIDIDLDEATGIATIIPKDSLHVTDFEQAASIIDPYIKAHDHLNGLVIYAEEFPGWFDFAALISHFKFVRNHHQQITKVAAVSDATMLTILPDIADHFTAAEVRHFDYSRFDIAMGWIQE